MPGRTDGRTDARTDGRTHGRRTAPRHNPPSGPSGRRGIKKRKERGKSKGREKQPRSGCLTSADETIRPSQCFSKRACGCEQRRQQVRHGSITNNTRVETHDERSRCPPDVDAFKAAPREVARQSWVLATDVTCTHAFSGRFRFTDDFLVSETVLPLPPPE